MLMQGSDAFGEWRTQHGNPDMKLFLLCEVCQRPQAPGYPIGKEPGALLEEASRPTSRIRTKR